LLLSILVLAGLAPASTEAARPRPSKGVISSADDGLQSTSGNVWTAEAMRAAKPYPAPLAGRSAPPRASAAKAKPDGPAGSIAGRAPKGGAIGAPEVSIQSFFVPDASYASFPYSTVGKLFFNQLGCSFVCSAAMIKGHGIWTAGHCVHAGNNSSSGWSTNVVFVPQNNNGSAPLGVCNVPTLWTTTDWYSNGNPNGLDHDYAGGAVTCNVSPSTGWLGLTWNQSYSQSFSALGYPAAPPFNGLKMVGCNSGLAAFGFGTPTTYGIVCDMTGGSSGGPWHILGGYVNGNTSYSDSNFPGLLFSPYYDSGVKGLWDLLPS
jgi:hypothetical protein